MRAPIFVQTQQPHSQDERSAQLAAIVTASADAIKSVDLDGIVLTWNPGAERLFGFAAEETIGRRASDLTVPATQYTEYGALLAAVRTGKQPIVRETVRRQKDGTFIEVEVTASPICNARGEVSSIAAIYRDVSERKRSERRQLMLMSEISHRGKNLFAVINAIVGLSLANARSIEAAKHGLLGRLEALLRTYGRLTEAGFEGERLKEILDTELMAFGERIQSIGPDVMLTGRAVQTFALVAHELATNASKYGALSVPAGQVKLKWSVSDVNGERRLRFDWRESQGPRVAPPQRAGFGTLLITSIAASDFDCSPEISYDADGFRYGFEARLSRMGTLVEASPVRRKLKSETLIAFYDQWMKHLGTKGELPKLEYFNRARFEPTGALTSAAIDPDLNVSFIEIGRALLQRLQRPFEGEDISDEDTSGLVEAYRRCARSGRPCYEHLRFDFGEGEVVDFERLLIPYSETGFGVTHVIGIAVFSGQTAA